MKWILLSYILSYLTVQLVHRPLPHPRHHLSCAYDCVTAGSVWNHLKDGMDNKALYLDEPLVVGRSENGIVSIVLEHHSIYDLSWAWENVPLGNDLLINVFNIN